MASNLNEPDIYGRVWMHCESGLNLTKACMARFMVYVLKNRIEIGQIYAFDPRYDRTLVCVSLRLRPDQFEDFERATGGKLKPPTQVKLA